MCACYGDSVSQEVVNVLLGTIYLNSAEGKGTGRVGTGRERTGGEVRGEEGLKQKKRTVNTSREIH